MAKNAKIVSQQTNHNKKYSTKLSEKKYYLKKENLMRLALNRAFSSRSLTNKFGFSVSDGLIVLVMSI